jgi:hypothetical protein
MKRLKNSCFEKFQVPEPDEQTPIFFFKCILYPVIAFGVALALSERAMIWEFFKANHAPLAAIGTIFIAISSLWVSLRSLAFAAKQREHNELSIRPYLEFTRTRPTKGEKESHGIYLRNFGTGPAKLIEYKFKIDGTEYSNSEEFIVALKNLIIRDICAAGFSGSIFNNPWIGRYFVPALFPNQSERILWIYNDWVEGTSTDEQNIQELIEAFHCSLDRIQIDVSYITPHNKKLTASTENNL